MRTLRMAAIVLLAGVAAEPASAYDFIFQHGFTSGPSYQAKLTAVMQNTDVPEVGENATFSAWVLVEEGNIIDDSLVTIDSAESPVCGWVAGSQTTQVSCPTPFAKDTSVTDGRLYCARGRSTFKDGQGNVKRELSAGRSCTTLSGFPPGPTTAGASFLGCQDQCARWRFTFAAPRAIRYRLERRPAGGVWNHHETLGTTSYIAHLGGNDLSWRVRGENAVAPGTWDYFNTAGRCNTGDGGPGGPGPID